LYLLLNLVFQFKFIKSIIFISTALCRIIIR